MKFALIQHDSTTLKVARVVRSRLAVTSAGHPHVVRTCRYLNADPLRDPEELPSFEALPSAILAEHEDEWPCNSLQLNYDAARLHLLVKFVDGLRGVKS